MADKKRGVEVFSAGCSVCDDTAALVNKLACRSCDVVIHDMREPEAAARAKKYGVKSTPSVVVNGVLAACCTGEGVKEAALRAAGVGVA